VTKIRGSFMKKLFITVMLFSLTFSTFSQDTPPANDPYTKFQGVWDVVIDSEERGVYIFLDDILIIIVGDMVASYRYSIENQDLILTSARGLGPDGWGKEWDQVYRARYVFSNEKLILVSDGEPIILSRHEGFDEWR
jgi:hypothetical protein